jgi:asparagine synthase (glutamine-hydrolysing)
MPSVVWHAEKPLVRTAPAPLYLLSGLVHDAGIKVVLSGEGADELLGGYDLFRETKIRRFWARNPGSAWRGALLRRLYSYAANWQRITPAYLRAFYKAYLSGADGSFFSHLPRWDTTAGIKSYFSDALKSELASGDCVRDLEALLPAGFPGWSHLSRAQYIETATLLSGNLLSSQGDRMAMAHSVEGRYPFLDHRVAEFCAALPERLRLKVLAEKYLLKKIARQFLPAEVVERPKQAYRAPDAPSFFDTSQGWYMDELLSADNVAESGYFHAPAVARLVQRCRRTDLSLLGAKGSMALTAIVTTLLLDRLFVRGHASSFAARGSAITVIDARTRGARADRPLRRPVAALS